jgi:apolipoprotein D and lipocalin family protein
MRAKILHYLIPGLCLLTGSAMGQEINVVQKIDLERYIGKWYEIASLTGRFQKGCECTTAEYDLVVGKYFLTVKNRCFRKGKWSEINGKAFFAEGSTEGKLKVQFFWPFKSDYWIIDLPSNYSWAVVCTPNFKYVWILSRNKQMNKNLYEEILLRLRQKGFDTNLLHTTSQNC